MRISDNGPFRTLALAMLLLSAADAHMPAQTPPLIPLKPSNGKITEEFSAILSVRELADGRVLITDQKEDKIVAGNPKTGTSTRVGRKGDGPGEFRNVGRLWPLVGDSTLMMDNNGRRWILFESAGIVGTVPPTDPGILAVGGSGSHGTDASGHVVVTQMLAHTSFSGMSKEAVNKIMTDSMAIARVTRVNGRIDTIGRFPGAMRETFGGEVAGGMKPSRDGPQVFVQGMDLGDAIAVFTDGWVAVNRGYPHRVDWCAPNAKCVASPFLPIPWQEMTEADKQAYMKWEAATEGWLPPNTLTSQIASWPKYLPAYLPRLFPLADGRLLLGRFPRAGQPQREYNVIDRRGTIASRIVLPLNEQVVGVGAKSIFIAAKDADGVQHLRRHPWP